MSIGFYPNFDQTKLKNIPVVNRTEARFSNSIRFLVRFHSVRFFEENQTEYLQDKINDNKVFLEKYIIFKRIQS